MYKKSRRPSILQAFLLASNSVQQKKTICWLIFKERYAGWEKFFLRILTSNQRPWRFSFRYPLRPGWTVPYPHPLIINRPLTIHYCLSKVSTNSLGGHSRKRIKFLSSHSRNHQSNFQALHVLQNRTWPAPMSLKIAWKSVSTLMSWSSKIRCFLKIRKKV